MSREVHVPFCERLPGQFRRSTHRYLRKEVVLSSQIEGTQSSLSDLLKLGPEHRVTLGHMMEKLDDDAALDAAARTNTRENVRLTFDQKVEHVIQEIVDSNFDLYKRITDERAFGDAIKNFLFDQHLHAQRNAEELIRRGEDDGVQVDAALQPEGRPTRRPARLPGSRAFRDRGKYPGRQ